MVIAPAGPRFAHAQSGSNDLTVSIISPANGGGAAGQTLEAGAFAIVNDTPFAQSVSAVTIAFSNPSIFSSASLTQPGVSVLGNNAVPVGPYGPSVASGQPAASTTFTFHVPYPIPPGGEPVFALIVKMASSISRNETGNVAYAAMTSPTATGASAPLWLVLAMLGLAMAALPGARHRRAAVMAALAILLAVGAPGCGSDHSSEPSSTQSVAAVSLSAPQGHNVVAKPIPISGLPLRLGVVTWK